MRNSCNHEEFPGVNVLFQTILPMINEKDEEIKRLRTENENLKSEKLKSGKKKKKKCIQQQRSKITTNEELKKVTLKLQDQLEIIFVDAMHNTGPSKQYDHEKTKFKAEMDKLESFVTSVEPYSCNREAFPGVNVLFQTIHSNMIKEKDEEIERLLHENEQLKKKENEHMQIAGRRIKIESIVQLVLIIIALILVSTLVGVYFHFCLNFEQKVQNMYQSHAHVFFK